MDQRLNFTSRLNECVEEQRYITAYVDKLTEPTTTLQGKMVGLIRLCKDVANDFFIEVDIDESKFVERLQYGVDNPGSKKFSPENLNKELAQVLDACMKTFKEERKMRENVND